MAGSISKVGNAVLILRLVSEGVLGLDADVNDYLQRWHVPAPEFTNTIRSIASFSLSLGDCDDNRGKASARSP